MNEVEIVVSNDSVNSMSASEATRGSIGANFFNSILTVLGIRVPHQKLYNSEDHFVTKLRNIFFSPFRVYSVIVFGSLCVLPIKFISDMTKFYTDELLLHFVSETIIPIQYVLAILYYGSNHIQLYYDVIKPVKTNKRKSALTNIRDIFVDIKVENKSLDFEMLIKQPCRITIKVVSWAIVLTIVLSFIGSLLTSSFDQYKAYYPFFLASRLLGRGVIVTNVSSFAFVFYKHVKVLKIYAKILQMRDWSNQKYDKISVMLINLTRLRESLKISTDAFKNLFSTGTISGAIIIGVLIHGTTVSESARWGYDSFIVISSLFIFQSIVFGIIAKLSLAKEMIEDVTKNSEFASKFLSRKKNADATQIATENASTLDYWLITDILSGEWLDFSVMGIPIHSLSFIKQCVSLSSVFIILANTGTLTLFNEC